jgi:hypothetical protein
MRSLASQAVLKHCRKRCKARQGRSQRLGAERVDERGRLAQRARTALADAVARALFSGVRTAASHVPLPSPVMQPAAVESDAASCRARLSLPAHHRLHQPRYVQR